MSKKEVILETALKLFATQGVGATATAEITAAAGVAEGTLFVHFKNKQALVDAVYLHIKTGEAEVFGAVLTPEATTEENIRALGKVMVEHFLGHYHELLFIEQAQQLNLITPKIQKEAFDQFATIGRYVKAAQKAGEIKALPADMVCTMMWSQLIAIVHYCKDSKKKVSEDMLDAVWDALKAK